MERAVYLGIEAVMGSKTEARVYAERGGGMMVSLVIPAEPSRFMIARSVVTAIAAQVGLPIDAIEDARLAVTECSNLLCALGRPDHLRVRMWLEGSELVLEVAAWAGADEWVVDPPTHALSWVIVSGLAETSWAPGTGGAAITTRWPALMVN